MPCKVMYQSFKLICSVIKSSFTGVIKVEGLVVSILSQNGKKKRKTTSERENTSAPVSKPGRVKNASQVFKLCDFLQL